MKLYQGHHDIQPTSNPTTILIGKIHSNVFEIQIIQTYLLSNKKQHFAKAMTYNLFDLICRINNVYCINQISGFLSPYLSEYWYASIMYYSKWSSYSLFYPFRLDDVVCLDYKTNFNKFKHVYKEYIDGKVDFSFTIKYHKCRFFNNI